MSTPTPQKYDVRLALLDRFGRRSIERTFNVLATDEADAIAKAAAKASKMRYRPRPNGAAPAKLPSGVTRLRLSANRPNRSASAPPPHASPAP